MLVEIFAKVSGLTIEDILVLKIRFQQNLTAKLVKRFINMKKKLIYTIGILILTVSVIAMYVYSKRSSIAESLFTDKLTEVENLYDLDIEYDNLKIIGLNTIILNNLKVKQNNEDFFAFSLNKAEIKIDLISYLKDEFCIQNVRIDGVNINIGKKTKSASSMNDIDNSILQKIQRTIKRFMVLIKTLTPKSNLPNDILLTEVNITLGNDEHKTIFYLPEITFLGNNIYSQILVKENFINEVGSHSTNNNQYCIIEGVLGAMNEENNFKFYSLGDASTEIPFLKRKINTSLKFDTLFLKTTINQREDESIVTTGKISLFNLFVHNPRLSKEELQINFSELKFKSTFDNEYFEIDSSSSLRINDIEGKTHLYLQNKKEPLIRLHFRTDSFPSANLFNSIPAGICNNLKGIETEGNLIYNLRVKLDMANIDSLEFSSELASNSFNITKFGATDFREANGPMLYNIYNSDNSLEIQYEMSEENIDFRKLNSISPLLRSAVMFSEDGLFFHHKGFIESAIRASIIKNIKEKRFARGGSTISMQLIKNLWLNKEKTASRKLEEALIVWIIENERLISKERMFELYLNIIEWGPHVYGAAQASHFYFNKDVDKLTLNEAIFMASIIPRPKKFFWYFDKNRNLKPFLNDYYQLIGSKMLKHGIISERQFNKLESNVKISGHASAFLHNTPESLEIVVQDTSTYRNFISTDSLRLINDLNLYFPNDENIQNVSN